MEKEIPKRLNKRQTYETNTFYHYANEYRKHITNEDEIEKIDMTPTFKQELYTMMDRGELINMNINGLPTYGKSTTGFAIADDCLKHKYKRPIQITDIDRDQQEFSKTMRNPNIQQTIRVIDEWNELETTGENSSVEQALYNYFSDVMAQRFIHKISCSPKDSPDRNAVIYLEIISMDKIRKINHAKLYYKIFANGTEILQLLGYVDIYVGDILKQKWYKEYRRRKFEKMDLILKEGIFRPRILEYAHIILTVTEKLRKLTKLTTLINPNVVRNYIKMEFRTNKIPQSIIGEELSTREVLGILDIYKSYHRVNKQINLLQDAAKKGKMEKEETEIQIIKLEEMRDELTHAATILEDELKHYQKINEKYNINRE